MDKYRYFEGIEEYRLLAKHEVGQNFLIDPDVSERITGLLDLKEGEQALEIGSGAGSLTYFLLESPAQIEAIDIDEALIGKLKKDFGDDVNVHYGNAAKWDYAPYDKIIGNLPYYITSLIIEKALLLGSNAKKMVFMVQKEAADRLLSDVGSKEYGPLPILIALSCKAKRAFSVKRSCFAPAPHIDSTVMVFEMKPGRCKELSEVYRLCNSLFLQRRKTLLNNLKNYLHDGEKAKEILDNLGLALTIRPEQVTPEQYLRLYEILHA